MKRLKAALLGSTGAVGQRYISLLRNHPWIELEVLMGDGSVGKRYKDAARWQSSEGIPTELSDSVVEASDPKKAESCDLVFSAVPSEAASRIEHKFAESGKTLISEASSHRMDIDVPLIIPEVNESHLGIIETQRTKRGWPGAIVTTPNCTVTGLAIVLKPLSDAFGLKRGVVTSMQAISGAGFPGVPSLSITENVIPFIENEEEKVALESMKILGRRLDGSVTPASFELAISCNRVPVIDGHMETLYAEFDQPASPDQAAEALRDFKGPPQELGLPTAPKQVVIVRDEPDRPQPRLDRLAGSVPGMSVVVGRIRRGPRANSVLLTLLSHNTIRGAAGTAILTAELMASRGLLEE